MKATLRVEINVIELFLHEQCDCKGVDEDYLAEAINGYLQNSKYECWAVPPFQSGLGRFIIETEVKFWNERCHSEEELREYLPVDIFNLLKELDAETSVAL